MEPYYQPLSDEQRKLAYWGLSSRPVLLATTSSVKDCDKAGCIGRGSGALWPCWRDLIIPTLGYSCFRTPHNRGFPDNLNSQAQTAPSTSSLSITSCTVIRTAPDWSRTKLHALMHRVASLFPWSRARVSRTPSYAASVELVLEDRQHLLHHLGRETVVLILVEALGPVDDEKSLLSEKFVLLKTSPRDKTIESAHMFAQTSCHQAGMLGPLRLP